jgi:hypothetical protein
LKPNSRFLVFSRHLPKARPADWIVKQYWETKMSIF